IDKGLDELKARLKPVGEVITYLPSAEAANDQQIELDVILGAQGELPAIEESIVGTGAVVTLLPRSQPSTVDSRVSNAGAATGGEATAGGEGAPAAPAERKRLELRDEDELTLKSVAQTVRVDIRKLDNLMNVVGELGIARAGLQQILERLKIDRAQAKLARELHHELRSLSRRLDELQAGILEVRMVPLGQVFDKLSRVVRKISRDAGKEIRLAISGADTELDKLIVEELSDPLMHVIRNCIDHGIERPELRLRAGKPAVGTIGISAEQRGNHVVITVEDDGAGIDEKRLVERALERRLIEPAQAAEMSRRDVLNLMFLPGVST